MLLFFRLFHSTQNTKTHMPKILAACKLARNYKDNTIEVGSDESGRGTIIFGVYAAAVILNPDIPLHPYIKDSKKLSRKRRAEVRTWIEKNAVAWSVCSKDEKRIDDINILQASLEAMREAIEAVSTKIKFDLAVIDGNYFPTQTYDSVCVTSGDSLYAHIAAASILAKEYHDDYIKNMVNLQPELGERYDLLNNMGYATQKHIEGLQKFGASEYHRKSFSCVTKVLPDSAKKVNLLEEYLSEGN